VLLRVCLLLQARALLRLLQRLLLLKQHLLAQGLPAAAQALL
jgi:hypothetical protein